MLFRSWNLYLYYLDMLEEEEMDKIYYKTYPPFLHTLFNMSLKGIPVDTEKLKDIGEHIQQDLDELLYKMIEITGVEFEPSSRQHLCQLLFGYSEGFKTPRTDLLDKSFHFPIQGTTKTGQPQTGVEVLKYLAKNPKKYTSKRKLEGIEVCKLLIEYSKLDKLKTSFVDGIFKTIYDDGKCHPQYQPVGTDSGRISCSKPNLMQLPNADEEEDKYLIRDCFIGSVDENTGKRNHIISIDYSNLEVRVMAHFSQDEGLIKAFNEGKDLHGNTAKLMFRLACDANEVKKKYPDLRQQGKVIAFLLQYGGSSYTLYDDLNKDGALDNMAKQVQECYDKGIPLPSELEPFKGCTKGKDIAQRLMDIYFEAFPGIARFMRSQKKYAHRHKYVYTLVQRKRRLPEIDSENFKVRGYNERLSINACIQGSGADIMINAQNKIDGTIVRAPISHDLAEKLYNNKLIIGSERLKELKCNMLVQIHDELLFECPEENCEEAIQIIRDYMINPFGENVKLNLPLDVGAGHGLSYQNGH